MTLTEFWPQCLLQLKQSLPSQQYQMWIAPLTVGEENGNWVIFARNTFTFNHIRERFWPAIESARQSVLPDGSTPLILKIGQGLSLQAATEAIPAGNNSPVKTAEPDLNVAEQPADIKPDSVNTNKIHSEVSTKPQTTAKRTESAQDIIAKRLRNTQTKSASATAETKENSKQTATEKPEAGESVATSDSAHENGKKSRYTDTNLNPEHTFAALVQGKGNRLAHAAALSIAENPGNSMYNPFFIYGSTGLGKTHLVQAIGNQLFATDNKVKIRYIHADEFIRGIMNAFHAKSFDAMRQQYQQVDLLIMDDVQFIAGKDRTMEEFFYVYNHLIDEKKQVILTCDTLPTHIDGMDDRLKSRFSWGLSLELEPPELEMRVAILQKKAEMAQVKLEDEAAFFIAKHIRSNVRELEGAFKRVVAQSRFASRPIDVGLATEALQDILAVNHKPMTLEHIQNTVAKFYGITISDMVGKKRTRNLARPRQMAMTLAKELTPLSLPAIGSGFGGRDHTTVMHAVKSISKLRKDDAETTKAYETLMMILRD
ncbi:chromosomal replication initiator protein DnaA [Snodgrassella alvi]|uniref:chromosomal replication initiator protein DnaA n=1 Tax=Snodgrassella alvi TaxID=1196083 RepID=UPI000C1EA64C|nr:chromosomal replication initiator protein DnaA [Snodgrassella alvi]PIT35511.1 chromosomal replication initiation protein DnaA [Snodgrassella alvi]PIT36968.1 chromosomal replication initiation protein DnaA [Snodgrassella alvi]WLT02266.1 chromosomal replication initiator protein DnaA [Snodgrassella alvi]WLT04326.1 chromosomal replication initiator protein DnaA [Snodgrassella alvi]